MKEKTKIILKYAGVGVFFSLWAVVMIMAVILRCCDIYSKNIDSEDISDVVGFIKWNTNESDYIFAVPYESMFYFLTKRDNPTKYNQFLPGTHDEQDQRGVIAALEARKPKYIIYGHGWALDNVPFSKIAPLIHNYIVANCTLVQDFGIYSILGDCFNETDRGY